MPSAYPFGAVYRHHREDTCIMLIGAGRTAGFGSVLVLAQPSALFGRDDIRQISLKSLLEDWRPIE